MAAIPFVLEPAVAWGLGLFGIGVATTVALNDSDLSFPNSESTACLNCPSHNNSGVNKPGTYPETSKDWSGAFSEEERANAAKNSVYNNENSEDEKSGENAEGENKHKELPKNPDDLLDDRYEETTDPRAPDHIRRFKNPETGDEVEFHEGKPDKPGWEGKDHWHRFNPDKSGRGDAMLDKNGKPVPKNSKPSHIDPNR